MSELKRRRSPVHSPEEFKGWGEEPETSARKPCDGVEVVHEARLEMQASMLLRISFDPLDLGILFTQ